jgi:hypothetical protein
MNSSLNFFTRKIYFRYPHITERNAERGSEAFVLSPSLSSFFFLSPHMESDYSNPPESPAYNKSKHLHYEFGSAPNLVEIPETPSVCSSLLFCSLDVSFHPFFFYPSSLSSSLPFSFSTLTCLFYTLYSSDLLFSLFVSLSLFLFSLSFSLFCVCILMSDQKWFSWRKLWAFTGPGFLMSIAYHLLPSSLSLITNHTPLSQTLAIHSFVHFSSHFHKL